jgi:hypothetical protein
MDAGISNRDYRSDVLLLARAHFEGLPASAQQALYAEAREVGGRLFFLDGERR